MGWTARGARVSAPVQTGPRAHPASYTMGTESFPGGKAAGAWRWPPIPSSGKVKEAVQLYLYSPLWAFVACYRVNCTFITLTFTLEFYIAGCTTTYIRGLDNFSLTHYFFTHWGRVTQICAFTHINNLNTLSPMCSVLFHSQFCVQTVTDLHTSAECVLVVAVRCKCISCDDGIRILITDFPQVQHCQILHSAVPIYVCNFMERGERLLWIVSWN
jgi:hypothetical protein